MAGRHGQGQRGDILGDDLGPEPVSAEQVGVDARLLPVLFQAVDLNPERAVVAQRPGGEPNLDGHRVAAHIHDAVDAPIDLVLGLGRVPWPALAPITWTSSMPSFASALAIMSAACFWRSTSPL